MLTTKDNSPVAAPRASASSEADLKFISENQRLEGFSGEITEAVRQHVPDLAELKAATQRFLSQQSAIDSKR